MAKEKINKKAIPDQKSGDRKKKAALSSFFSGFQGLCLLLFLISIAVYGNTLHNGFAMDDIAMIEKNTIVQKGFEGISELMETPRLAGFDRNIINENYRPLSLVMFAAEYQFFGADPFTGHLFNILFFAGCVILLFLFLDRLFPGHTGTWFIASLLFALHPIHTEVVANIKSRDELMSFFFGFASLLLFMGFQRQGRPWKLGVGAFLLLLAFLSKETVISFLFIVPVLFYGYLNERRGRSHTIFAITLIVATLFLLIRNWVLKGHDSSAVPFLDNPLAGAPLFTSRIPTAIMVLGMYLKLLIIPWPLISDYSYNTIPAVGFGNVWVWCSMAVYLAACFTVVYGILKKPKAPLAFGILFYLANLALFSNLFFLAYSEMAERLVFFASAGFCIAVSVLLFHIFSQPQNTPGQRLIPVSIWWVMLPVSLAFAILTINRNAAWANDTVLLSADTKKAPGNARLWYSIGCVKIGNEPALPATDTANRVITRAGIADVQKSLTIYPDNYKAHLDIGNFFRHIGQFDSAEYHIRESLRLNPGLSIALSDLGFVYFSEQKYPEALALVRNAFNKDNKNPTIMFNMGMIFTKMKQYDSAKTWLQNTLKVSPDNKQARDYLTALQNELQKAIKKGDSTNRN